MSESKGFPPSPEELARRLSAIVAQQIEAVLNAMWGVAAVPDTARRHEAARQREAARQEAAFRATHPDYDAVLARAGIWQIIIQVEQCAPLTSAQHQIVMLLRAATNPAEAAYGLALTRIGTGEIE